MNLPLHIPHDSKQFLPRLSDPFSVQDAPRGTVAEHPLYDYCYWVRGSGDIYRVQAWRHGAEVFAHCPCLGFSFRRTCTHVKAVAEALLRPVVCPVCRGAGVLEREAERGPSVTWMDDEDLKDVFR